MEITCHCGNIVVQADVPKEIASCNCSICRRYAAYWAYYPPEQVSVRYLKEPSVFYIWGDKEVEFHRCNLCGCLTHYVTTEKCDADIVAINMRMAEEEVLKDIPLRLIDGKRY
ncbi:GFA family protein [Vibrio owensii]|uniref:Aldehyde-activating protein n=1 Tax=Vibrio owensii CAIM 1854 = LMG 25443 TaxID=1229493 RepID=A0A0C1YWE7_9VIBR|nr:aldehyde-activating protein [Vibrio owensii]KIF49290.1 aldehyde-activating protein [Vibrio owensii CAIM 1854 = LMG 25443]